MKVVALAGGVGGAKLADGIAGLGLSTLTVIVNTGDDFKHFGLYISPDLDTVCYNLAGMECPDTGWGRAEDSWETFSEIKKLGGPTWFSLGNKDLATHLERTRRLNNGEKLSQITTDFCQRWGVKASVLPMSDDLVPTIVKTNQGDLNFQDYFVKLKCEPEVSGFFYQGADKAQPAPGVIEAINQANMIVICPSNPWVSIAPILAIPEIKSALLEKIVIAVSPIISGKAVKGPAAKMYREMGIQPSAAVVANHYDDMLTGFILDQQDKRLVSDIEQKFSGALKVLATNTWMKTRDDRARVAEDVINFGKTLVKEV